MPSQLHSFDSSLPDMIQILHLVGSPRERLRLRLSIRLVNYHSLGYYHEFDTLLTASSQIPYNQVVCRSRTLIEES
jgi:hypothetical protein